MHSYTITLIAADLLADIGATDWATKITADDMATAWRKFVAHRRAAAYRIGSDGLSVASDYDISLDRDTLPTTIGTT